MLTFLQQTNNALVKPRFLFETLKQREFFFFQIIFLKESIVETDAIHKTFAMNL